MDYIYPTNKPFVIPKGTTLKRTHESPENKRLQEAIEACVDKERSNDRETYFCLTIVDEDEE